MHSVMNNIYSNLTSGEIWRVILVVIPLFCSLAGISLGVMLIWRLLNWKFDTKFHKRWAKRAVRRF